MTERRDVVVVGAGVAGFAAALACRRAGADVLVLHGAAGATVFAGGAWDVAPPPHPDERVRPTHTVAEWVRVVAHRRPAHPYARLADPVDALARAHGPVLEALGGYRPLDLQSSGVLLATDFGILRRAASAQRELLDLDGVDGRIAVVDPGGYPGWDAAFLAASLHEESATFADGPQFSTVGVALLDPAVDAVRHPHELGSRLDGDPGRRQLGEALREAADGHGALLLPPLLGVASDGAVGAVQEQAGIPVGEAVGALAGPQGLRLDRRLRSALDTLDVETRYGPVAAVVPEGGGLRLRCTSGDEVSAVAVVLATGKHVGGGLEVDQGRVREPVAGLPVRTRGALAPLPSSAQGPDPVEQFGADWWAGGAGFVQGVGYDASMRALGADGEPAMAGLFVAGALLDGFDPARDGTGLGCCATTGFVAGEGAAAHAGRSG